MKLKTNIKCDACVAKVTPGLDEVVGKGNWLVDLNDVKRTMTIPDSVDLKRVEESLRKVGYKAEKI
jgi:copper chaperone CopZ